MRVSSLLASECTCNLTKRLKKQQTCFCTLQGSLHRKLEAKFCRHKPFSHARRPCLAVRAASTTGTSAAGRIQGEKEIAEALVQTDLPYTTHSWQWRGHKVNYAVRAYPATVHRLSIDDSRHQLQRDCCGAGGRRVHEQLPGATKVTPTHV